VPTFTFHEHFDGRPASASTRSGRRLTRRWECVASEIVDGVAVISALTAEEGVYFGASHPSWAPALCSDLTAEPDGEDYYTWMVTAEYEEPLSLPGFVPGMPGGGAVGGQPGEGGSGTPYEPPRPEDRPTYFSIGARKEPKYFTSDLDNLPLVNAVGDPLEDVPPVYYPIVLVNAKKFYATWSIDLTIACFGRVNQDEWLGYDPYTWLIESCHATPKTQGPYSYWEVDFDLAYNEDKWVPTKLLNAGRRYFREVLVDGGGFETVKTAIVDQMGKELPGLHALKADGTDVIAPGDPPVTLDFRFYRLVNFNGLIDP
jgi:hypothetical protein